MPGRAAAGNKRLQWCVARGALDTERPVLAAEQGDGNGRRKIIMAIGAALLLLIWLTTRGQPHSRLSFSLPENVRDRDWQRFHRDSIQRYGETAEADGVAILQLAVQLHGQDQTEAALRCLMQIPLELERLGVDAALQRGRLLYAENRVRDAEEAIRTAMSVCPSENKAARDLATRMLSVILAIELRFEERKSLLAEAAERNELPPALLTQYCFGPLIPWKTAAQAKRIKELLERDSGDPALWIAHARHLQSTGQAVAAVQVLKQIREQLPNSKPALAALLEVHHGQADVAAMIELLNQADEFSAAEPWLLTQMRAEVCLATEQWQEALPLLTHLNLEQPGDPTVVHALMRVAAETGDQDRRQRYQRQILALSELRMIVASANPGEMEALTALSTAARKAGLVAEAGLCDRYIRRPR